MVTSRMPTAALRRGYPQGPLVLHRLRRMGDRAHLPDPRRSRSPALVLVDDRNRSHDALGPRGNPGGSQSAASEKLDAWKPARRVLRLPNGWPCRREYSAPGDKESEAFA
jgi:hypothetical protein